MKGDNEIELTRQFRDSLIAVSGEYIPVGSKDDLIDSLTSFLDKNNLHKLVIAGSLRNLGSDDFSHRNFDVLADFARQNFEREEAIEHCSKADAGLSGVDLLIAETGTIVVASRGPGDRLVSTLPPVHIAIVLEAPVVADIRVFIKNVPRFSSYALITGPSRTADIEKKLVLGAHGPVRVVIFGPEV